MESLVQDRKFRFLIVPMALVLLATAFLVVPLIGMFTHMDAESIRAVFNKDSFLTVLGRSVTASLLTTLISIVLAYGMSWCTERTAMPGKKVFRLLVSLPMLIPSVSIGMGVVLLLGNSGILTNLLEQKTGNIYGLSGIVLGSVMYALPVAFLMIENILKYEDSSPYEAATVLGISKWKQFCTITVPYLRKPMIAVIFSVFTLSFTDYGVPLMVGGKYKTLPVVMYQEVIGQLNFGKGCVYGSILLIPAIIAFLLDLSNKNNVNNTFISHPFAIRKQPRRDVCATVYSIVMCVFSILPILSFLVLAFMRQYPSDTTISLTNITRTMQLGGGKYLINSVVIALCVSVIGVVLAILTAYYTARTRLGVGKYLHLISMSMAAIPGVVLGLAYVLQFKNSVLYGTMAILIAVNVVHFFASPYLMIHTTFSKMNENLESVAWTLGVGRKRMLLDVLLPMCRHTVAEMFSYFFVNSMMTISAVSFLANSKTKPVALMINQFEAQAQMEYAAVISLAILLVNLFVKIMLEWQPWKARDRK